jgi:Cu/Ag efflux pump CusA
MNVNFYYRDPEKKLRQLAITEATDLYEARQAVLEHLHQTGERFLEPLLGVIQGGTKL